MSSNKGDSIIKREKIVIENLNVFYKKKRILENVNIIAEEKSLTCIVGPSGCGKTTLLMAVNRLIDEIPFSRINGNIWIKFNNREFLDVMNLNERNLPFLRRKVGLVFQHPNVLPMSIFKNMAFALKMMRVEKGKLERRIEAALKKV